MRCSKCAAKPQHVTFFRDLSFQWGGLAQHTRILLSMAIKHEIADWSSVLFNLFESSPVHYSYRCLYDVFWWNVFWQYYTYSHFRNSSWQMGDASYFMRTNICHSFLKAFAEAFFVHLDKKDNTNTWVHHSASLDRHMLMKGVVKKSRSLSAMLVS